jgi:hypothetical protein
VFIFAKHKFVLFAHSASLCFQYKLEQNLNTPQLPLSAGKRARASAGAANIAAKAHKGAGTTRTKQ